MEKDISYYIKRARKNAMLTQVELAKRIRISSRVYQEYEYGNSKPGITICIRIADELNVSLDYLTGRTDDNSPFRKENKE